MQLYPHWLDGEFVRIASKADGQTQTIEALTRALKLHALLGTEFVLSDVQVFDSAAVLELFADPEFRAFVERDRSFLNLRVSSKGGLGDSPFQLAARGLMRTQNPDWISSACFGKDALVKALADEIIDQIQRDGYIDPSRHSVAACAHPNYVDRFNAARHAVYYFATRHTQAELTARPIAMPSSYYEILKGTLDELQKRVDTHESLPERNTEYGRLWLSQTFTDMENVGDAITFIDKHIPDENDRKFRSKVHAILGREPNTNKQVLIWNNVVQAWSYAAAQTIQPNGMSSGTLPHAVSPAPILQRPMDVLVPFDHRKQQEPLTSILHVPVLPVDLKHITWTQVAEARTKTAESLHGLALVRANCPGDIDAISVNLRTHIKELAKFIVPPKEVSAIFYALKISEVVVASFGIPAAGAMKALGVVHDAYNDLAVKDRNALVDTLYGAAVGPN